MTSLRVENLSKQFGSTTALAEANLTIGEGEMFFLLGPSGCGKTTLLRLIAGLYPPTTGRIFFNERDVTDLGTEKRNAVMVFQSYALWPHMTVRENIAFGPSVRGVSEADAAKQINEVLKLVHLESLADRRPAALSGGQQQRAALARALAVRPACLLLDEPLSNLDAKLRGEMRSEIRRICKSAGCTTIYVTHDQKEALAIADRVALMKDGRIVQIGTPAEMYDRPRTQFAAGFLGQTNLISGTVSGGEDSLVRVQTDLGTIVASGAARHGQRVVLSIRPERLRACNGERKSVNRVAGRVVESTFLGDSVEIAVMAGNQRLKMVRTPPLAHAPDELAMEFDPVDAVVLED